MTELKLKDLCGKLGGRYLQQSVDNVCVLDRSGETAGQRERITIRGEKSGAFIFGSCGISVAIPKDVTVEGTFGSNDLKIKDNEGNLVASLDKPTNCLTSFALKGKEGVLA